jgi:hypothetical protein
MTSPLAPRKILTPGTRLGPYEIALPLDAGGTRLERTVANAFTRCDVEWLLAAASQRGPATGHGFAAPNIFRLGPAPHEMKARLPQRIDNCCKSRIGPTVRNSARA